jgi:hypothetical protein
MCQGSNQTAPRGRPTGSQPFPYSGTLKPLAFPLPIGNRGFTAGLQQLLLGEYGAVRDQSLRGHRHGW